MAGDLLVELRFLELVAMWPCRTASRSLAMAALRVVVTPLRPLADNRARCALLPHGAM